MKIPPPQQIYSRNHNITKRRKTCAVSYFRCNFCKFKLRNRYQVQIHQTMCHKKPHKPQQTQLNSDQKLVKSERKVLEPDNQGERERRSNKASMLAKNNSLFPSIKVRYINVLQTLNIPQFTVPPYKYVKQAKNSRGRGKYHCRFCKLATKDKAQIKSHQNNCHFLQHQRFQSCIVQKICSYKIQIRVKPAKFCQYHLVSIYPGFGSQIYKFYKCQFCSYTSFQQSNLKRHLTFLCNFTSVESHQEQVPKLQNQHMVLDLISQEPMNQPVIVAQGNQEQLNLSQVCLSPKPHDIVQLGCDVAGIECTNSSLKNDQGTQTIQPEKPEAEKHRGCEIM